MANCILCGQKVGLLDRKNFMFHGTVQTLCIGCTARLDSAAPPGAGGTVPGRCWTPRTWRTGSASGPT